MTTDISTAKRITFNRDTRDFDAFYDDNYIGSFATHHQAENELNQHVLRLCEDGLIDRPLAALAEQALDNALALDTFQAGLIADLPAPHRATCGGEGNCPDCDPAPTYHAPGHCRNCGGTHHIQRCSEVAAALSAPDSPHTPSLSQAIALGLVGTPDPTCSMCDAPAFVWCDGQMFCKDWWQHGQCDVAIAATDPDDGPPPPWDAPAIVRKTIVAWQCNRTACAQWLNTFNDAEQRMLAQAVIAYRRQFFDTGLTVERLVGAWKGG